MAGIDVNSVLMLHGNGTNGSQVFTDSSPYIHIVGYTGASVTLDTTSPELGSASIYFNGSYLTVPASANFVFTDFTIDFWYKTTFNNTHPVWESTDGSIIVRCNVIAVGGAIKVACQALNGITTVINCQTTTATGSTSSWQHIAIVRQGSQMYVFINGISQAITYNNPTTSATIGSAASAISIGHNAVGNQLYGHIDEYRVSNSARWIANFTPPITEYTAQLNQLIIPTNLSLLSSIPSDWSIRYLQIIYPSVVNGNFILETPVINYTIKDLPNVINGTLLLESPIITLSPLVQPQVLTLSGTTEFPKFPGISAISNAVKIISYNPLIVITSMNPLRIAKINTSIPSAPDANVITCPGVSGANDVVVDTILGKIWIACDAGKIVECDINTFATYTIYTTGTLNNIKHIANIPGLGLIIGATDYSLGEIVLADNSTTQVFSTDIRWLQIIKQQLNLHTNTINAKQLSTDIRWLETVQSQLGIDIRFTTIAPGLPFNPISRLDFHVYINGVECTDCKMDAISVYHTDFEKSKATIVLARQHDNLDYTLEGVYSPITNSNSLQVYINGYLEFNGFIWNIDSSSDTETVKVEAYTTGFAIYQTNPVTLSVPSINEKLGIHHVLIDNPHIYNPHVDAFDPNPPVFKGVAAPAGTRTRGGALHSAELEVGDTSIISPNPKTPSDALSDGSFIPDQNWTYFWYPTVENFMTGNKYSHQYIGTSLSSVSGDTWEMTKLNYFKQIIPKDRVTQLGGQIPPSSEFGYNRYQESARGYYYTLGTAPFKIVGATSGESSSGGYFEDNGYSLTLVVPAGFNYTPYVYEVLSAEYRKLCTINGPILPETSVDMHIFIDTYYYYGIKMLNRINIDNTITPNIYNKNNGFPVSVKSIEISSSSMTVNLHCDNKWSRQEMINIDYSVPMLDVFDPKNPDKELNYRTNEQRWIRDFKFDINKQMALDNGELNLGQQP